MKRAFVTAVLVLGSTACGRAQDPEAELSRQVEELLPSVQAITGLEAVRPVRVASRDREALREYLVEQLREELPPEELRAIEATYRILGLVPDTLDLGRLLLDLYTEQVVGYYDPPTGTLYMMEDVSPQIARPVLAHELVHALQDQAVDLDSLISLEGENDRETAAQAAIEGHATLAMTLLQAGASAAAVDVGALPDLGEQLRPALEAQNEKFPVFRDAPRIVRETVLFPYLGGAGFVQEVWAASQREGGGPPDFVTLLPASTEQVLHPGDAFLGGRDAPTGLDVAAPAGWTPVYDNTLGELETGIFLRERLGAGADSAARGWDGDRFLLLEAPGGDPALLWYSVWDDAASADRFADALRRALAAWPDRRGAVERLELGGRPAVRAVLTGAGADPAAVPDVPVALRDAAP